MSFIVDPLRIEDEVFGTIGYGAVNSVDEFTLNRFYHSILKCKGTPKFDAKSYAALGMVLYNMGRFSEFLSICREGLSIYPDDIMLYNSYVLGLAAMKYRRYYDLKEYDIFKLWFDSNKNPERRPFSFMHRSSVLKYAGNIFPLSTDITIKIVINYKKIIQIISGPFEMEFKYISFNPEVLQIDEHFTFEITERIRQNTITSKEINYFKYFLGDNYLSFEEMIDPASPPDLLENRKNEIIEEYDSVEDFMESLLV